MERVVYEHHYELQRTGEPLTFDDLGFDMIGPVAVADRDRRVVAVAFIATWDRSVSSKIVVDDHQPGANSVKEAPCAKASKPGRKSFVRQHRSLIKKDTTALLYPISCERPGWRKAGSTVTLRANRSSRAMPSTTLGKSLWRRASKEQRRSRIRLTA